MEAELRWEYPPGHPVLTPPAVHVWRAPLRLPSPLLARLERTLSCDERVRAQSFRALEHRHAFVAARGILRDILSRYLEYPAGAVRFRYSWRGKPALASPMDHSGISFNVSHSGDIALYVVALKREVGVDVEKLRPMPDCQAIALGFFSARENDTLGTLPAYARDRGFFQCWTCKEAYIKAVGEGLSLTLADFDVRFGPGETPQILSIRDDTGEADRWMLCMVEPADGYLGALALRRSPSGTELRSYVWPETDSPDGWVARNDPWGSCTES
jgi:4'-phosphopantetheinyl transferase